MSNDLIEKDKNTLQLPDGTSIDISDLPKTTQDELKKQQAQNLIDLQKKAAEMQLDLTGLGNSMQQGVDNARKAQADGTSMTMNHTQESTLGRTEFVVGNTDKAAKGQMPSGQQNILIYVIIAAAVVVFLALVLN